MDQCNQWPGKTRLQNMLHGTLRSTLLAKLPVGIGPTY